MDEEFDGLFCLAFMLNITKVLKHILSILPFVTKATVREMQLGAVVFITIVVRQKVFKTKIPKCQAAQQKEKCR